MAKIKQKAKGRNKESKRLRVARRLAVVKAVQHRTPFNVSGEKRGSSIRKQAETHLRKIRSDPTQKPRLRKFVTQVRRADQRAIKVGVVGSSRIPRKVSK